MFAKSKSLLVYCGALLLLALGNNNKQENVSANGWEYQQNLAKQKLEFDTLELDTLDFGGPISEFTPIVIGKNLVPNTSESQPKKLSTFDFVTTKNYNPDDKWIMEGALLEKVRLHYSHLPLLNDETDPDQIDGDALLASLEEASAQSAREADEIKDEMQITAQIQEEMELWFEQEKIKALKKSLDSARVSYRENQKELAQMTRKERRQYRSNQRRQRRINRENANKSKPGKRLFSKLKQAFSKKERALSDNAVSIVKPQETETKIVKMRKDTRSRIGEKLPTFRFR